MHFEVSERLNTAISMSEVMGFAEFQLNKISESVSRDAETLTASSIEASFGSINRSDDTVFRFKSVQGGYLIVSETHYRPSFMFWVFFIAALFTYVGWVVPMVFYFHQRGTVKAAIEGFMARLRNEFISGATPILQNSASNYIANLQALADLRDKGVLTDEEFQREKAKLLSS